MSKPAYYNNNYNYSYDYYHNPDQAANAVPVNYYPQYDYGYGDEANQYNTQAYYPPPNNNTTTTAVYSPGAPEGLHPFHYGLCHCCQDCKSCTEAWWCFYCQLSRQFNWVYNQEKECSFGWTCLFCCLDVCVTGWFVPILMIFLRYEIRKRYALSGSGCYDCMVGCFCSHCSLQQNLLEFTVMGDFPGATCYDVETPPSGTMA